MNRKVVGTAERAVAEQVAWACRILAMAGHDDLTLGHVSARIPGEDVVLIKRKGLGLEEVTPADVIGIDLDGNRVSGEGEVHLEAVLHTEVYRARPDVHAVIHSHPPFTTALGATDAKLDFLSHDAVLFPDGLAVFEDTPDLITMLAQGRAVARALGTHRAVLLRNHGIVVVGKDVPWAVITALTLERAVMLQVYARALGPLRPIPPEAVRRLHPSKYRDAFVEEYWPYLIRRVRRHGLAGGMPEEP